MREADDNRDEAPILSVIVPVYNEAATVVAALERLVAVPIAKQVVVVDDGSTDESTELIQSFAKNHPEVEVVRHETNRGKGAAIHTALPHLRGAYSVIHDADLEYDPNDLLRLLQAARERKVRVVYGSRILGGRLISYRRYYWGGRLLSLVASILYGQWITDESTCYKLLETSLLQSLPLKEKRFGFCAEVTALVRRLGERILEVPISYTPRSMEEGKKIRWTDGLRALWILLRERFARAPGRTQKTRPRTQP